MTRRSAMRDGLNACHFHIMACSVHFEDVVTQQDHIITYWETIRHDDSQVTHSKANPNIHARDEFEGTCLDKHEHRLGVRVSNPRAQQSD